MNVIIAKQELIAMLLASAVAGACIVHYGPKARDAFYTKSESVELAKFSDDSHCEDKATTLKFSRNGDVERLKIWDRDGMWY